MKKRLLFAVILLAALSTLGLVYSKYSKAEATKKADAQSVKAEQKFMEEMTSHHMDAIQMAQMAQQKGQTKSVKTIAERIVTAQNKEISQMKDWYKKWYGTDMPEMAMMPGMMEDGMDMSKLDSASDFDLEFVSQMIPHHQSAIRMAKDILPQAKHQEIKTLANDIINGQGIEIQEMQGLQDGFKQYPAGSTGRHLIDCGDDSPGC